MISETAAKAKSDRRKVSETPPPTEWKKAFGDKCQVSEDGQSFDLTLHESRDIKRAIEMQSGSRDEDIRRGAEMQAKMPREKVVRKADGHLLEFPEDLVDNVKHKFRPVGRNGKAPAVYFGPLGQSRWVKGTGTLWFFWDAGWEPRPAEGSPHSSPQIDPDGNVWVESNGEWLLEDEVS